MSVPKRHHYLPVFYQERFTQDGYLWVYDRQQRTFRREQPKNTAVKRHYYSLTDDQGKNDPTLEQHLAWFDGVANDISRKLDNNERISPQERVRLALWLGILYCRTPSYERTVDEIITGTLRMILRRNLNDPVAATHFTNPDATLKYVNSKDFKLRASRNYTINHMLRQGKDIGKTFAAADWVIARAPNNTSFVTSDAPVGILAGPNQDHPVGIASPEVIKAVPLSPQTCLLMIGNGGKFTTTTLTPAEVSDANIAVLRETENYALARDKTHLQDLVAAAGIDDPKNRSRMVVKEFPDPAGDPMRSILVTYRAEP